MQPSAAIAALVLVGLVGAFSPAFAQSEPHSPPGAEPGAQEEALGEALGHGDAGQSGPASEHAARQAHLASLFDELADPDNHHWERTQAQIYAAWNRSGSPSMDLLSERADKAIEAEDYDTALLHLNDLTRLAPDFAEGWNKRATVYFLRDEYGRSLGDIGRVLALEPRHFGAYSGLGIILDRLGDKKGALDAYRHAVALHPKLPGAAEGIRKLTREVEGERL
jgi:tetratricopeptide (TPR) repeat protein